MKEVKYVCYKCGVENSPNKKKYGVSTFHGSTCDICENYTSTTSVRNYDYLRGSKYEVKNV